MLTAPLGGIHTETCAAQQNFYLDNKEVAAGAGACPVYENGFVDATRRGTEIQKLS